MSERKFDYDKVRTVWEKMKEITGTSNDENSIAGILSNVDDDYRKYVPDATKDPNMETDAIFGELGNQLLLDWDNASSNFGSFVDKFDVWAQAVAAAANDYAEFENMYSGFVEEHSTNGVYFGASSTPGMYGAYTNTGYYANNSFTFEQLDEFDSYAQFYALTGAQYLDTDMVSILKKHDFWEGVELGLDVIAIVASTTSVIKYFKNVKGGVAAAAHQFGPANRLGQNAANAGQRWMNNSKFIAALNKSKVGAKLVKLATPVINGVASRGYLLNAARLGTNPGGYGGAVSKIFLDAAGKTVVTWGAVGLISNDVSGIATLATRPSSIEFGEIISMNGQDCTFFAQTKNGTFIVTDEQGNLKYTDPSGNLMPVTFVSGGTTVEASLENLPENVTLRVGTEDITDLEELYFNLYGNIQDDDRDITRVMTEMATKA